MKYICFDDHSHEEVEAASPRAAAYAYVVGGDWGDAKRVDIFVQGGKAMDGETISVDLDEALGRAKPRVPRIGERRGGAREGTGPKQKFDDPLNRFVGLRVTGAQADRLKALGGSEWLRDQIELAGK